jgi:ribosomal protein S18 acetylase RimI-like enzyme
MDEAASIRRAVEADVPFLIEAICEAEKGGTDCLSYCRVFDLTEAEFHAALREMLLEDLVGQELCVSGFLIAESGAAPVAACCAWVEGATGIGSTILKANLLLHYLGRERVQAARRHFRSLDALTIAREPGAIQIESVYVRAPGRGRGLAGCLVERHLEELRPAAQAAKAQVILAAENRSAASAYGKLGFAVVAERSSDDEGLLALVPSRKKLSMERSLSQRDPLSGSLTGAP